MFETPGNMKDLMARVRKKGNLPSSTRIVNETFIRLGYTKEKVSAQYVLENFNAMLHNLWIETLTTLESYEEKVYSEGIPKELFDAYPDELYKAETTATKAGFAEGFFQLFKTWYPKLRKAFQSISQSRMTRGGKDFELQIEGLLNLADISFIEQERKQRTDLILPNFELFEKNRNLALIVSVKRTLRERWAEVAEELFNLRSPNVYLFTADENITLGHIRSICGRYNIYLVVWDEIKKNKFLNEQLVMGYTEWATKRLAVARQNWPQK